jgi:hypothetical protein
LGHLGEVEHNTKMDLKYAGCEINSSGSGLGSVAGSCDHDNVQSVYIKGDMCLPSSDTASFSRSVLLDGVFATDHCGFLLRGRRPTHV